MYQLLNTFAGGDEQNQLVSQHKTLDNAIKANNRLQRKVKAANGQGSYLPTRILKDWEPLVEDEYEEADTRVNGY